MSQSRNKRTLRITPRATALTIAGSDPSGGAGLQADLKTFQQTGVYGMSAVTLLTVQNTQGVARVETLKPQLIRDQIRAVMTDIPPAAIKIGALGTVEIVRAVAEEVQDCVCPIVIDPVLVSKHGHSLADDDVVDAYCSELLPLATIVTPNRFEAERLTGVSLDSPEAAGEAIEILKSMGVQHTLIKFGKVNGRAQHWLSLEDVNHCLEGEWLEKSGVHGSGCVLSAAITAAFAIGDRNISRIVDFAIEQTYYAIWIDTRLGKGIHPADVRAITGPSLDHLE
jgi:hydroxymethylpyrimidine/phosphomethylpyrimidine kinase